jgi:hypothetical protein
MHTRTRQLSDRSVSNFGRVVQPGPMPEFDSGTTGIRVHTVEPSAPPPALSTESLLSIVTTRLTAAQPISEALQEQKAFLLGQTTIDLTAVDAFLDSCKAERELSLVQRQEASRAACRKQFRLCANLHQALKDAELNLMRVAAKQGEALEGLKALALIEKQGKHTPRWATAAERAAWDERLDEAKERVRIANEEAAVALQARNNAQFAIEPAQAEMQRLASQELRLRREIEGHPYVDPEFGLSSVPAGRA